MLGTAIAFAITIIVVVFLFLLQLNKTVNAGFQTMIHFAESLNEERERFLSHINKLEDRIQTGDAKQAAILNKEQPEKPDKPEKPKRVNIGTADGLEVNNAAVLEP